MVAVLLAWIGDGVEWVVDGSGITALLLEAGTPLEDGAAAEDDWGGLAHPSMLYQTHEEFRHCVGSITSW